MTEGVDQVDVVHLHVLCPCAHSRGEVVAADVVLRQIVGDVDGVSGIIGSVFSVAVDKQIGRSGCDVLARLSAIGDVWRRSQHQDLQLVRCRNQDK